MMRYQTIKTIISSALNRFASGDSDKCISPMPFVYVNNFRSSSRVRCALKGIFGRRAPMLPSAPSAPAQECTHTSAQISCELISRTEFALEEFRADRRPRSAPGDVRGNRYRIHARNGTSRSRPRAQQVHYVRRRKTLACRLTG